MFCRCGILEWDSYLPKMPFRFGPYPSQSSQESVLLSHVASTEIFCPHYTIEIRLGSSCKPRRKDLGYVLPSECGHSEKLRFDAAIDFCLHDQFFVLCTCWVLTQNWYLHFESAGATPRLRALSRESSRQPWRRHVWESWEQDQCELLPGASENSVFPSLKDYPRGNQWWFKVVHTLGQHGISIYK